MPARVMLVHGETLFVAEVACKLRNTNVMERIPTLPTTAFSASLIRRLASDSPVLFHKSRKLSTASKLSLKRCSVLIRATTSDRCRRLWFLCGLGGRG